MLRILRDLARSQDFWCQPPYSKRIFKADLHAINNIIWTHGPPDTLHHASCIMQIALHHIHLAFLLFYSILFRPSASFLIPTFLSPSQLRIHLMVSSHYSVFVPAIVCRCIVEKLIRRQHGLLPAPTSIDIPPYVVDSLQLVLPADELLDCAQNRSPSGYHSNQP